MQVERAAQVTHSELTITDNLTKIFPNSKCVMCHCPFLLESHIVLNTMVFPVAARIRFAACPGKCAD